MFHVFVIYSVAILPTMISAGSSCGSSYKYDQAVDGYVKLHAKAADWLSARAKCRQEGGEILSPITSEIMDAMAFKIKTNQLRCNVFTGIHDTYTPGTFYAADGTLLPEMDHLRWHTYDCHSGKSNKNIVVLRVDSAINTASKNEHLPYFCFKKQHNESECGCADSDYVFSDRTGSCYKFHPEGRTWHEAADVCASEEGHLAVINSPGEAQVLQDLFKKYPESVIDSLFKNSAMIGFLNWGKSEGWQTIFGATLKEAGYSTWSPGQPDHSGHPNGQNIAGVPFCGAIFRSAQLDDIWCDVKFAFICEKRLPNN